MLNSSQVTQRLLILLFGFILLSIFIMFMNMLILWFVLVLISSIFFIYKHCYNITKKDILIGLILSIITMLSNFLIAIFVLPSYLAAMVIMKDKLGISLIHLNKKEIQITLFCVFVIGSLLGALNVILANYPIHISFHLSFLFNALRAGIAEEIIFRLFLFSLCMEITKHASYNRLHQVIIYCIMIIPHVLLHFSTNIDIVSVIVLGLFFGLPFALMQRKSNLISAIGAHSMVDLIRFIILGV